MFIQLSQIQINKKTLHITSFMKHFVNCRAIDCLTLYNVPYIYSTVLHFSPEGIVGYFGKVPLSYLSTKYEGTASSQLAFSLH